jgi:hypothetical protein
VTTAGEPRERAQRAGAGGVEVDHVELAAGERMRHRHRAVARSLEVLGVDLREVHDAHAPVLVDVGVRVGAAGVDGHLVAALDELRRQLLDRALDPAVGGRDAAQPDHRDSHRQTSEMASE